MSVESKLDHKTLEANRFASHRQYWRNRLKGFEPEAYFNFGKSSGVKAKDSESSYICKAPDVLVEALNGLAGSAKAKHVVLLAALSILIRKGSSLKDIWIFTPLYRNNLEPSPNTLAIPIRVQELWDEPFAKFLIAVRDSLVADFDHGNYPALNVLNGAFDTKTASLVGLLVKEIHDTNSFSDLPVEILFSFRTEGELELEITYQADRFDEDYIARLSKLFFTLLHRLLTRKNDPISSIEMIPDDEKNLIMNGFNQTERKFSHDATVVDLFEAQTKKTPDAIALRFQDKNITYRELDAEASQVANYLAMHFQGKGHVIAVNLDRSLEFMIAVFGILKAGCIYLPISTEYPVDRIRYVLDNSNALGIFCSRVRYADLERDVKYMDMHEVTTLSEEFISRAEPTDLAYIIYTSGSTGRPKGVQILHRSVVNRIEWMQNEYSLGADDTIIQKTPTVFDVSIWELFWWSMVGSKLVLAPTGIEKDPHALYNTIVKEEIRVMHFVPSMLHAFLNYVKESRPSHALTSLRLIFTSGEELKASDVTLFHSLFKKVQLHNLYGPTEATVDVSYYEVLPNKDYFRVPIGKPIDNTQLYVLNENRNLQPIGIPGELFIGGVNLSIGYVGLPELTNSKFVKSPFDKDAKLYRTGDLAKWMPDGNIEFLGRIDHQVKIRGNRIELGEVEHVLKAFDGITDAVALAKESTAGSLQLVGYVISDGDLKEEELRKFMLARVPEYMVPSYLIQVDAIPLTINGKVDRAKLLSVQKKVESHYSAPSTELEKQIVDQWKTILGENQISIDDSFFRIGGDSILAVRLIGAINREFDIELTMADLYENDTVLALSKLISKLDANRFGRINATIDAELIQFDLDYKTSHPDSSIEAVYPMIDIEKAMCYVTQYRPEDLLYFEQLMWPVTYEVFHIETLQRALDLLTARHDTLRKSFDLDEFAHLIHKELKNQIVFYDLTAETNQKSIIASNLEFNRKKGFDLNDYPFWRVTVYKLATSHHELVVEYHHSVLDGWSIASFVTELNNTYGQLLRNEFTAPKPLASGYKDVVALEIFHKRNEETRAFWKKDLQDFRKLVIKAGPDHRIFKSVRRVYPLQLAADLETAAQRMSTTVKNIMLAAYIYAIKILTSESDILTGVVTFSRPLKQDGDKLLGCFLNTIPFRVRVPERSTWEGFVQLVHDKAIEVKKYENLSLFEITQSIGLPTSAENPLFDTTFNYINWHIEDDIRWEKRVESEIDRLDFDVFLRDYTFFDLNYNVNSKRVYCMHEYSSPFMTEEIFEFYEIIFLSALSRIIHSPESELEPDDFFWDDKLTKVQQEMPALQFSKEELHLTSYSQRRLANVPKDDWNLLNIDLTGKPDKQLLEQTLQSITRKYEILRTGITMIDGDLCQQISRGDSEVVSLVLSANDIEDKNFHLALSGHPAYLDRFSLAAVGHEFLITYKYLASLSSTARLTPQHRLPFLNYSHWEQKTLKGIEFHLLSYWKRKLGQGPFVLTFPSERAVSRQKPRKQLEALLTLPSVDISSLLKKLSKQEADLKTIMLGALKILMHNYCSQDEIVVGVSTPNRENIFLKSMIGPLDNVLISKTTVTKESTFRQLISSLDGSISEGLKHYLPFEVLSDHLGGADVHGPMFNVFYDFNLDVPFEIDLGSFSAWMTPAVSTPGKFDLGVSVTKVIDHLQVKVVCNSNAIDRKSLTRLISYFKQIVRVVCNDPDTRIGNIEMIPSKERERLLFTFNDTRKDLDRTRMLGRLFEERADLYGDAIAVEHRNQRLSYSELYRRVTALARRIDGFGTKPVVGIYMTRGIDMLVSMLATFHVGGAYVPIDVHLPDQRVAAILTDCQPQVIVVNEGTKGRIQSSGLYNGICVQAEADELIPFDFKAKECKPGDLAYIIYTSGTTGKPKGAMVHHLGMLNHLYAMVDILGLGSEDHVAQTASAGFDISVWQFLTALLVGGTTHIIDEGTVLDPHQLMGSLREKEITIFQAVPSLIHSMLNEFSDRDDDDLPHLRWMIPTGEALSASLARQWYSRYSNIPLLNAYGPAEASDDVTTYVVKPPRRGEMSIPIGKPIQNTHVYILDSYGKLCPVGVKGEICISGIGVGLGYHGDQDKTRSSFVPNPYYEEFGDEDYRMMYKTGDVGYMSGEGHVVFSGRGDDQLKIRGYRIEPGEIQYALQQQVGISEVAVVPVTVEGDKHLAAYYVSDGELEDEMLKAHLLSYVPDYMVPSFFVRVEKLPLNSNGKLDKKLLPAPQVWTVKNFLSPANTTEYQLQEIWSKILSVEKDKISTDTSFFDIGGHSLKAVVLVNQIAKVFGVRLTFKQLFENPTILGINEQLKNVGEAHSRAGNSGYKHIKKAPKRSHYPLSSAQKRLFFLDQFSPGSIAYNMPFVLKAKGSLNQPKLETAFRKLIARHEILRTSFEIAENGPIQKVLDHAQFELEEISSYDDIPQIVKQFIRPFNLGESPLLRAAIATISEDECLLMIDLHHIVSDGVSDALLVKDLRSFYENRDVEELPLQYTDFAVWQNSDEYVQLIANQKQFWINEFKAEPVAIELPYDFTRPQVSDFKGKTLRFQLSVEETNRLNVITEKYRTTPFVVLLSIYNILLFKLRGSEDIVVGTPIAGRNHPDLETMIGLFVNTLPLRNFPKGESSFSDFLADVRSRTIACFDNQSYEYELLIDDLQIPRNTSRNPLFDVMFSYENFDGGDFSFLDFNVTPYSEVYDVSKFDLTLTAFQEAGQINLSFEYATALFKEKTIRRLISYFKQIVRVVCNDPDTRIGNIEMIPSKERERLLFTFNDTRKDLDRTRMLGRLFEERADLYGDAIAVEHRNQRLSYSELYRRVTALARRIDGFGTKPVVGIYMTRGIDMLVSMLATFHVGGAYVPIDVHLPDQRVAAILTDCQPQVIVVNEGTKGRIQSSGLYNGICVQAEADELIPFDFKAKECKPGDLAYIIYTSGTTGKPKGAMVHHLGMLNHLYAMVDILGLGSEDHVAQTASAGFDISVWQFLTALLVGGTTHIIDEGTVLDPHQLMGSLREKEITIFQAVPSLIHSMLNEFSDRDDDDLPHLRWMIPTGEALSASLARQWYSRYSNIPLLNAYGPAEASDDVTTYVVKPPRRGEMSIPIGKPIQNTHVYILDSYGKLCPVGVKGEICISGIGVGLGYHGDQDKTRSSFVPNPYYEEFGDEDYRMMYKTGDVGYMSGEGHVVFSGRGDDQLKIRGYRIEPGEIQYALQQQVGISEVAVVPVTVEGDKHLAAYYVSDGELEDEMLKAHLLSYVPDYMVPSFFVRVEKLPLNSNGKLDKKLLPAPQVWTVKNFLSPANTTEYQLQEIWSKILSVEKDKISTDTSFFDIGGHSLKAVVLVNQIAKVFGVNMKLVNFFSNPTIKSTAAHIETRLWLTREDNRNENSRKKSVII
ncbi:MAG: amino acid adenylation domain-containing protein [Chryseotalea sp. WA131a]|nr:MAG: amino acid adenylation domain-containing protein [Chryseotalea sp. WA131a]